MKKFGFTLAEVLVTLSIVGIIAALTIPTFVANSRNKANAVRLSTVITAVENSLTTMMANEGVNDLTETAFVTSTDHMAELSKYLKASALSDTECITKSGAHLTFSYATKDVTEAKANAIGYASLSSIGTLTVDVNGKNKDKPEKDIAGRDVFKFHISSTGNLHPAGGKAYSLFDSSMKEWEKGCNNGEISESCTARLIEEGFQVNY